MPHPKVKISDDSGNAVGVTDNRLDVNVAGATMSTGDITIDSEFPAAATIADDFANPDTTSVMSMLMGYDSSGSNWNRLLTDAGTMSPSVLRVTLATDDTHFGEVGSGTAASTTGPVHGQLRYIADKSSNIATSTALSATHLSTISTLLSGPYETLGSTTYTEGVSPGNVIAAVRNDTLDALADTNNEFAPFQVNASGALYVDIADGGQLDTIIDTLETTLTAIETDQAAIEALLITIDSDTDAIKTAVQILDDWDDSNYANVNINLAGSDAPTGGGAESGALRVTLANDSTGVISIDDGGNTITVDGTVTANLGTTDNGVLDAIAASLALLDNSIASGNELQVDVVAALPAGTDAIGKVGHDITGIASDDNDTVGTSAEKISGADGDVACKRIDIMAHPSNTGEIWVGDSAVTTNGGNGGIRLLAGDFYSMDIDNTGDVYVVASVDGENVCFNYFT